MEHKSSKRINSWKVKQINLIFTCPKDLNHKRKTQNKSSTDYIQLKDKFKLLKMIKEGKMIKDKNVVCLVLNWWNILSIILKTILIHLNLRPRNFTNSGKIHMKDKSMELNGSKVRLRTISNCT